MKKYKYKEEPLKIITINQACTYRQNAFPAWQKMRLFREILFSVKTCLILEEEIFVRPIDLLKTLASLLVLQFDIERRSGKKLRGRVFSEWILIHNEGAGGGEGEGETNTAMMKALRKPLYSVEYLRSDMLYPVFLYYSILFYSTLSLFLCLNVPMWLSYILP